MDLEFLRGKKTTKERKSQCSPRGDQRALGKSEGGKMAEMRERRMGQKGQRTRPFFPEQIL